MARGAKLLLLGHIGRPHGLQGEVSVSPYNPESSVWANVSEHALVLVRSKDGARFQTHVVESDDFRPVCVQRLRPGSKGSFVVSIEGVRSRTAADALVGSCLAQPIEDIDEPADDEFYLYEIKGWSVVTADGGPVGRVVGTLQTHVDLLEVAPLGGGETFYVPMIDEFVTEIDRRHERIVIELMEGLIP